MFSVCIDMLGFFSYTCYDSLHLMFLYATLFVVVVSLTKELSIIYSNLRSFCFVLAIYLFLVHCDCYYFLMNELYWSLGFCSCCFVAVSTRLLGATRKQIGNAVQISVIVGCLIRF